MQQQKIATTFGGSNFRRGDEAYKDGIRLGRFLAENGYAVRCGGYYGLMEAVAAGVHEANGTCIGVTLDAFDPKRGNDFLTREQKELDIFDRLRALIEGSALFVIQEGAIGTLAEFSLVWCLRYTKTLPDIRVCVIGPCWHPVLMSLRNLPIAAEHFELIELFPSLDSFMSSDL